MTTPILADGLLFAERYRVLRRIAAGGMGDVYEVLHLETNRRRALKVMQAHILKSPSMRGRFRRETSVTANIDSEFLVDIFDAGVDDTTDLPFLVMELLRGEELKKRVERTGRCSAYEVVLYLYQTALALEKTHKAGVVHRDLKPDNLFLTHREDGSPRIKVLDFGIAKILAGEGAHHNTTHEMVGTPFYMAPEQFRVAHPVSAAADIYSLGMIAYTLLVGAPYWRDEPTASLNILMFAAVAMGGPQEPASARARRRGVSLPSVFDAWFARATALTPEERIPTALLAVSSLADALGIPRPGLCAARESNPFAAPPPPPSGLMETIPINVRASKNSAPPPASSAPRAPGPPGGASPKRVAGTYTFTNAFSSAKTIALGGATRDRRIVVSMGLAAAIVTIGLAVLLMSLASSCVGPSDGRSTLNVTVLQPLRIPVPQPSALLQTDNGEASSVPPPPRASASAVPTESPRAPKPKSVAPKPVDRSGAVQARKAPPPRSPQPNQRSSSSGNKILRLLPF